MDEDRLVQQAFNKSYYLHNLHLQGKNSWVQFFSKNMQYTGCPFSGLSSCDTSTILRFASLRNIEDNYICSLRHSLISGSIKLQIYQQMRSEECMPQEYLQKVKDRDAFKCLARCRTGCNWLQRGRFVGQHRSQRSCKLCGRDIEDEEHMIFHCSAYTEVRQKFARLFPTAVNVISFMNQNPCHVAGYILGCQCIPLGE